MSWWNDFNDILHERASLAPLTWFRLGGPARWLFEPRDETQVSALLRRCREADVPVLFLGKGANLLVDDEGADAAVLGLDRRDRQPGVGGQEPVRALQERAARNVDRNVAEPRAAGEEGVDQLVFEGFAALPPRTPWYEVLGVPADCPLSAAEVAYRQLARVRHPDCGGSEHEMAELNAAIEEARDLHA